MSDFNPEQHPRGGDPQNAGRFSEADHPEVPDLDLNLEMELDVQRIDLSTEGGTFEYPPPFSNARDLLRFFYEREVPDWALVAAEVAYQERRKAEIRAFGHEWDIYYEDTSVPAATRLEQRNAYVKSCMNDPVWGERPMRLMIPWQRQLVRIAQIYGNTSMLPRSIAEQEMAYIDNTEIIMPGGRMVTMGEMNAKYRLKGLAPFIRDLDRVDRYQKAMDEEFDMKARLELSERRQAEAQVRQQQEAEQAAAQAAAAPPPRRKLFGSWG